MKKAAIVKIFLGAMLLMVSPLAPLFAAGTAADGWTIVQITKLESSGLFFKSYEGTLRMASFNRDEKCQKDECYTPILEEIEFSIDDDRKELAQFVNENIGKEMVVHYKIHRITPISLGTDFEILEAFGRQDKLLDGMDNKYSVEQTGSRRNYSRYGRFLRLERRGLTFKTYEGYYYDSQRKRIVPISVASESMARYIFNTMFVKKEYYIGISEAIVTVSRETLLDVFEINYKSRPDTL